METNIDNIKIIIRSILTSAKHGLSSSQLFNEYREQMFEPIPFNKFGHRTLIEFLKTMPDVVRIEHRPNDKIYQCFAVATKETKHIENMVKMQKDSAKGKKQGSNRRNFSKTTHPEKRTFQYNNINEQNNINIDPKIISNICKCICNFPQGIWLSKLNKSYQEKFGYELEFRPCASLYDLLDSLTEVKIIRRNGKDYVSLTDKGADLVAQEQTSVDAKGTAPCIKPNVQVDKPSQSKRPTLPFVDPSTKKDFQNILKDHPFGMWLSSFLEEYKKLKKCDLDPKDHGFNSIIEMVCDCSDVFGVEDVRRIDGEVLLYDITQKSPSKYYDDLDESEYKRAKSECMYKLMNIFIDNPNGVYIKDIEKIFKDVFNEDLPWVSLKYKSLREMLEEMEELSKITFFNSPRGTQIFPYNCENENNAAEANSPPPGFKESSNISQKIPEDAIITQKYSIQSLPPLYSLNQWVPIQIKLAHSPSHFYFQLAGELAEQLATLEMQMREFYNSPRGLYYIVPHEYISRETICVAHHPKSSWCRAKIENFIGDNQVNVFLIDTGELLLVDTSDLRFIRYEFLKLPAQALKAQLFDAEPYDKKQWSAMANDHFLHLVTNKPLMAKIHSINPIDNRFLVSLYIPSKDRGVDIASELSRRMLAWNCNDDNMANEMLVSSSPTKLPIGPFKLPGNYSHSSSFSSNMPSFTSPTKYEAGNGNDNLNSVLCQNSEDQVKRVSLGRGYTPFHLINLSRSNQLYMTYQELSSLFPQYTSLRKTLFIKNIRPISSIIIREKDHPHLFLWMKRYRIPDVSFERESFKELSLYSIKSVLLILSVLGHPDCKYLCLKLLDEANNFNSPEKQYEGREPYCPADKNGLLSLSIPELTALFQSLFLKRCDLLHGVEKSQLVNIELGNVDRHMLQCKERLELLKEQSKDMLTVILSLHS